MINRYEELDSLRGIAAVTVVLSHVLRVFPSIENDTYIFGYGEMINLIKHTPVRIIFAGYEAVILFFILSGFVLSLPFYLNKNQDYSNYLIKRFFRIYIPYISVVIITLLLMIFIKNENHSGLSDWYKGLWQSPIELRTVVAHVFGIGHFNANAYVPVLWSLVHEMRISIIFPFLMLLILNKDWRFNILFALGLSAIGGILYKLTEQQNTITIFLTIHYMGIFVLGATLAKYRNELIGIYKKMENHKKILLLCSSIILYTYSFYFPDITILHNKLINDWMIALGSACFIILALASETLRSYLQKPILLFVGKISYSLYLYHSIILIITINLLYGMINILVILSISFILSILIASYAHKYLEIPAIKMGQYLLEVKKKDKLRNIGA